MCHSVSACVPPLPIVTNSPPLIAQKRVREKKETRWKELGRRGQRPYRQDPEAGNESVMRDSDWTEEAWTDFNSSPGHQVSGASESQLISRR